MSPVLAHTYQCRMQVHCVEYVLYSALIVFRFGIYLIIIGDPLPKTLVPNFWQTHELLFYPQRLSCSSVCEPVDDL